MSVVYKAEDAMLECTVALKFLAPHLVQDPEVRKRFEREAKVAASLDHPTVCTVYEIEEAEGKMPRDSPARSSTRCSRARTSPFALTPKTPSGRKTPTP